MSCALIRTGCSFQGTQGGAESEGRPGQARKPRGQVSGEMWKEEGSLKQARDGPWPGDDLDGGLHRGHMECGALRSDATGCKL